MRKVLSRVVSGESSGRDPRWMKQIATEVKKTEVTLKAVLEERFLSLGEIADLKVGDVIELRMAQKLFEQVAKALQASFALVADTKFKLERIETRMDFAVIGRRNNQAVAAKFLLQALNRGGEM